MKVCWLTTVAAPYTIRLFNEISKQVDLYVVLHDAKQEDRNSDWELIESDSFRLYFVDKNYKKTIKKLAKECDVLVDGIYLSIYGYIAVNEFRKQNKKIIMAADGGIARDRGILINGIMSYLMNRHDYFFSSSEITDKYYEFYKVDKNKLYHYRFTSLSNEEIKSNKALREKKDEFRKELDISDRFMLLSVGRPIKVKGFDILLKAYMESGLKDKMDLYIVGGKPQEEIQKIVDDNKLDNVHFVGVLSSEELNKYYAAADASIICSRGDVWGLVINEALSFGLPVISSDMCVAGVHFALYGNNPMICELEDIGQYCRCFNDLYNNKKIRKEMSVQAFKIIKDYSLENSAEDIIGILNLL